ncbi:MAG: CerR family C-terminal domain-containing protein [Brachymonas sp.]|nr:CerR family C-terminal domain-containing protein [Brachymonas sp.]
MKPAKTAPSSSSADTASAAPERAAAPRASGRGAGRADGAAARARLLKEAVRLFAEQGFARTSTRTIAQAAGVNISAISYYFGDKEGLYRSAFYEPFAAQDDFDGTLAAIGNPDLPLPDALQAFFSHMLAPFGQDEQMRHCLRLHMREMLEPTGLWQQEIETRFLPMHQAMQELVQRHLGLRAADEGVQRLVLAIVGIPVYLMLVQVDLLQRISPKLLQGPVAEAVQSCTRYALALIDSEKRLRAAGGQAAPNVGDAAASPASQPLSGGV